MEGDGKPHTGGLEPEKCSDRSRVEDAASAAEEMKRQMAEYDQEVIGEFLLARDVARATMERMAQIGPAEKNTLDEDDGDDDDDIIEDEDDGEFEDDSEECEGLFDDQVDSGPEKCLARAADDYGFNFRGFAAHLQLDFYARARLVNFIRTEIRRGSPPRELIEQIRQLQGNDPLFSDDRLLKPVIESDPLLTVIDDMGDWGDDADGNGEGVSCAEHETTIDELNEADDKEVAEAVYRAVLDFNPGESHRGTSATASARAAKRELAHSEWLDVTGALEAAAGETLQSARYLERLRGRAHDSQAENKVATSRTTPTSEAADAHHARELEQLVRLLWCHLGCSRAHTLELEVVADELTDLIKGVARFADASPAGPKDWRHVIRAAAEATRSKHVEELVEQRCLQRAASVLDDRGLRVGTDEAAMVER